jgi:hyperosmotically inducible protein
MRRNVGVAGLVALTLSMAIGAPGMAQDSDQALQAALTKTLSKKELRGVQGTLQGTTAVLRGTVDLFNEKEEAGRRVAHVKGIHAIDNEIEVQGLEVPDKVLQQKLTKAIAYDRVGYGVTAFNAITVQVQNGVVTLGGHAVGPVSADSAVGVAANTKGVKDVINDIQLDPLSPFDDRIRIQAFRTIYSFPTLSKYASDPAKPIRISVANGNLTLYGTVDTVQDKDAAGIRANTVPGVFKVINNLQVVKGSE